MGNKLLLFSDECRLCRALAAQVHSYSNHRIQLLSLRSKKAIELLQRFYPDGAPRTYSLIEENKGKLRILSGPGAVLHLAQLIGFKNSLRLLASYLGPTIDDVPAKSCCQNKKVETDVLGRRAFLGRLLRVALGLALVDLFSFLSAASRAEPHG